MSEQIRRVSSLPSHESKPHQTWLWQSIRHEGKLWQQERAQDIL